MAKVEKYFVPSSGKNIYVEVAYPQKMRSKAPAVIVAHGLRSYYTGFLSIFASQLRKAGYTSVKFHYVGTGKSSGLFEDKTQTEMLQNYKDVVQFVAKLPNVSGVGLVGRSNSGSLATMAGPMKEIKAYVFLAPPIFYSLEMEHYLSTAKVKGKYFYHKSFKRPHTNGQGRLPLDYMDDMRQYDKVLLLNAKKMKPVIFFQSTKDEAVRMADGHYDYWKKNLPQPRKMVLINGGNHSYKGHKAFVIAESIKWFRKYLPVK